MWMVIFVLYISRYVGRYSYGVVDTDDDSESVVFTDVLSRAVVENKLSIEGVVLADSHSSGRCRIDSVRPYQMPEYATQLTVKTQALHGVEVVLWKDAIASISRKPWCNQTSIRLSDYCTNCHERIFTLLPMNAAKQLIIVLDDKLQIVDKTFSRGNYSFSDIKVSFDVKEVTDKHLLYKIYTSVGVDDIDHSIIDLVPRFNMISERLRSRRVLE